MNVKISVVMAVYNGSRYILEQLESIFIQTRKPDEVLIFDDNSSDDTYEIIDTYIKKQKLVEWKLHRNKKNLGWKHNFFQACSFARGDIIFFSDQDDIWHKEKIEKMTTLFLNYHMDALYTEKNIINEHGDILKNRMEKKNFSKNLERVLFSENFYAVKMLGCCECVSKKVIDIYQKTGCPECGHDSQCGRIALLYGSLWHLDEALIDYRMHSANSSGVSCEGSFGQSELHIRIRNLEHDIAWLKRSMQMDACEHDRKKVLRACYRAANVRLSYLKGDGRTVFMHLLKYRKCYLNMSMLLGDFAYRHKINKILGSFRWKASKVMQK